jgi:hypothetical protein
VLDADFEAHGRAAVLQQRVDEHRGGPLHHPDHAGGGQDGEAERAAHVRQEDTGDLELVRGLDSRFQL